MRTVIANGGRPRDQEAGREREPRVEAIAVVRSWIGGVMRISPERKKRHPRQVPQYGAGFTGTAWCVAEGKHFVTAFHVLNGGKKRDPDDKFFVFLAPGNGPKAFHFPVVDFPLEDAEHDLAILTIDPRSRIDGASGLPITFDELSDGTDVITCGFPAASVGSGSVDENGNWKGGNILLKSHANTGIVSAHYETERGLGYEFNVGWHHGESGGPICRAGELAAFSVMQGYRTIQTPNGVMPGPHQGISLQVIRHELEQLGANII